MSEPKLSDLVVEAVGILNEHNRERYAQVVKLLLAKEKRTRREDATPRKHKKQTLYMQNGRKVEFYRDTVKKLKEE